MHIEPGAFQAQIARVQIVIHQGMQAQPKHGHISYARHSSQ